MPVFGVHVMPGGSEPDCIEPINVSLSASWTNCFTEIFDGTPSTNSMVGSRCQTGLAFCADAAGAEDEAPMVAGGAVELALPPLPRDALEREKGVAMKSPRQPDKAPAPRSEPASASCLRNARRVSCIG